MQRILSIDTSGDYCSIALAKGEGRWEMHEQRPRQHAQIILNEIQTLARTAELSLNELDLIVYGRGPGSFTGLRIAAGVAQGLALAADCPIITVSTLQVLAWRVKEKSSSICAAIDARMGEFYVAHYEVSEHGLPILQGSEQVIAPTQWQPPSGLPLCVGNGWFADLPMPNHWPELDRVTKINAMPQALDALELALHLYRSDSSVAQAPEFAVPVYLRDDVTWKNKPKVGS